MFKNLILLSGFSTFVVFAIIGLNIYHSRTTTTLKPVTQEHSAPINSTFDTQTLNALKNRTAVPVSLSGKSGVITIDEKEATQGAEISAPTPTPTQIRPTPSSPVIQAIPPATPATQSGGPVQ